jgi:hypothetical protein
LTDLNPHIRNIVRHPIDPAALVEWMLACWQEYPRPPLLILTHKGDGEALDNRIRVKLSKSRAILRRAHKYANLKEFGFRTTIITWTDPELGLDYDALCIEYFVSRRHSVAQSFNKFF